MTKYLLPETLGGNEVEILPAFTCEDGKLYVRLVDGPYRGLVLGVPDGCLIEVKPPEPGSEGGVGPQAPGGGVMTAAPEADECGTIETSYTDLEASFRRVLRERDAARTALAASTESEKRLLKERDKAQRECDSLARRLAVRFEETEKLRTALEWAEAERDAMKPAAEILRAEEAKS